jgi:hypothetical protein
MTILFLFIITALPAISRAEEQSQQKPEESTALPVTIPPAKRTIP